MRWTPVDAVFAFVNSNDQAYYLRRALEEQKAACAAVCLEARERHEELAAAYRLRCRPGGSPNRAEPSGTSTEVDHTA